MSNVYIKLGGGVGNQLFQIACGYNYAESTNKNLIIDTSNWSASQGSNPLKYKDNLYKNFTFGTPTGNYTSVNEQRFNFTEIPYHEGDVVLSGYFQSFKYFQNKADKFINKLDFSTFENWKSKLTIKNIKYCHLMLA